MLSQKQAEEAIVSNYSETDQHEGKEEEAEENHSLFSIKSALWHGGSVWDAWFSCASNQVLYPSTPIFKIPWVLIAKNRSID
jgi:auxin influx carrier (AUX1 LAX family)